jgi:hypothetical protein
MENVESIADVCDSYDTVLADSQRPKNTQAEIPDLEVTNPAANDISPTTKTGKLVSR